ncbi:MAG: hypothetical protein EB125_08455 [Betaproteobacteria bacterium]|nr:hypothetical protein [Betaproteobacteria bacterium]
MTGTVAEAKDLVRTCVERIGSGYRTMEVLSEAEDSQVYIIGYTRNRPEGPVVAFSAKFEDGKVTFKGPGYGGVYTSLRDGKC